MENENNDQAGNVPFSPEKHIEVEKEKRNWMIYQLFVRGNHEECLLLIEDQLKKCRGLCEYALFTKGLILRQRGNVDEALHLFQAAAMLNPKNSSNIKQIGRCYYLMGKYKAALKVFEQAMIYSPDDWEIWYNRGICNLALGDQDEAEECFTSSNAIEKHDDTFRRLGELYKQQKNWNEAIETYKESIDISPDNTELSTDLGLLYLRIGETNRALLQLGKSISSEPRNVRTILAAGSVFQNNSEFDTALQKYRVAAPQIPDSARLWNNIGVAFYSKRKFVSAVVCLKRALYLSPLEWTIAFNLGLVHLQKKQYSSSFHYLSASISLKPDYSRSYMYLAIALSHLGDNKNAVKSYQKALEMEKHFLIYLNFSLTLLRIGKAEQAKEAYKKFVALLEKESEESQLELSDVFKKKKLLEKSLEI